MAKKAKLVASRVAYRGPVFTVTTDQVREPSGYVARRDVVRHQGSVVVMPVDDRGRRLRVLLVRQYRHAAGRYLWELPAGRVDGGESKPAAAKRELLEETGYRARRWKRALRFWVSPGFLDETMDIYLATGLTAGEAEPEADEAITCRFFPLSRAVALAMNGGLADAKTIAAVLWLARQARSL
jgi:ADP-ribose pyrophosphatase